MVMLHKIICKPVDALCVMLFRLRAPLVVGQRAE
jgi:hypothetical protein